MSVIMFHIILQELDLLPSSEPTAVYNDKQGAVNWVNTTSTKNMCQINIQENIIRQAILLTKAVTINHVAGLANPSEIFTKEFKSAATFQAVWDIILSASVA
jgi:hypothetical protein